MTVQFIIIGAQKAGTTSLAGQLAQHPEICFCERKEPDFFTKNYHWHDRIERYHGLFRKRDGQICGEASTSYTMYPEHKSTHERIHKYNPNMKLIYILRSPIDRIESHLAHRLMYGAAKNANEIFENPIYVDRSKYSMQLEQYDTLFPPDQILPVIFEEYVSNVFETLETIGSFLGVDLDGFSDTDATAKNVSANRRSLRGHMGNLEVYRLWRRIPPGIRHVAKKILVPTLGWLVFQKKAFQRPQLDDANRNQLWEKLQLDVARLEQRLGRSLHHWSPKRTSKC